ncbi:hypothetical protein [Azospirillum sp. TSO5]|uniref:hypothetical protein n=1 Tax=Azospirillum sp. TSO5 TaxID=716760 RepID=UPI000D6505D2|nr:hypothetical protein [Azospirillum sp. TSO5]
MVNVFSFISRALGLPARLPTAPDGHADVADPAAGRDGTSASRKPPGPEFAFAKAAHLWHSGRATAATVRRLVGPSWNRLPREAREFVDAAVTGRDRRAVQDLEFLGRMTNPVRRRREAADMVRTLVEIGYVAPVR